MLSHYRTHCARRRHFGLLRHALTEVSGRERRIALRYHPCRKVGNEVQAFQGHDACRHQVAGGEEAVLQVSRHRLLARRDCRQVLHLYAQHDVEQQQHVEAHEVEHRPVEMHRQIPREPLRPRTFPFGQERERPLYRAEDGEHSQKNLLTIDGRPLLYPKNNQLYNWSDANNTFLASELPNGWGDYQYWGGGHAISNYLDMDLTHGDFQHQLAVYYQDAKTGFGGHNGSKNFCVHYGYADNSGYANGPLPYIYFGDGVARVVDHMYVTMTTYLANCVANGNGLTAPAGKDDWVKLVAIGYDEDGKEVATRPEFYLVGAEGNILEWTKWDLSALGKVVKIDFNVTGSNDNGYGFSQPAYFAYDDVAVRF